MKKVYLVIISLLITFSAFSQVYRPMLSNSSEWYYLEQSISDFQTWHYSIIGDTVIANLPYKIVNRKIASDPYSGDNYYLREDSINKKVYWINPSQSNLVELLYDYNLLLGDTFIVNTNLLILDSISNDFEALLSNIENITHCFPFDSNNVDFTPKIFYFSYPNSIYTVTWIEGIGATGDLIGRFGFTCLQRLTCHFDQNGNKDLHISNWESQLNGECFSNTVGVNSYNKEKSNIISPNPNNGSNILINGEGIEHIKVYNIHGQFIKIFEVDRNEIEIDLKDQPKGIYLVKAKFKNGDAVTQKLILNR